MTRADRSLKLMKLQSRIGGRWVTGDGVTIEDRNPAHPDQLIATFSAATGEQVDQAVEAARLAFADWRRRQLHDRGRILSRAADILDAAAEEYGRELTAEEGKPLAEAIGEVRRAAVALRYSAADADQQQGEIYGSARPGERIWTIRQPVGPTALITPWNFPVAIPAWKLAPALLYGNTVVWKPSEIVPLLATRLTEALVEAGLPDGVLNTVLAEGATGSDLIAHPAIESCSFTGSTYVGQALTVLAAQNQTRIQCEMGGKNAVIVLEDANLENAAQEIVTGAMGSSGQKCTATSRVIVDSSVHDDLVDLLVERVRDLRVGDPMSPDTDLGPLVSRPQYDKVLGHLQTAVNDGATTAVGGGPAPDAGSGYYVQPTVYTHVEANHRVFTDEIFGPVAAVLPSKGLDQAVRLSNATPYGLSGSIFTRDLDRALDAIDQLEVGVLHVNGGTVGADIHVPFGGVKASGTSHREMGRAARDFFSTVKTVYVQSGS